MPTSLRQKFVDLVVARMQTILTAGGYETNIGQRVADSQTHWDQSELPATSVFDLVNEPSIENIRSRRQTNRMPLEIRVFTVSGTLPTEARKIIADVYKAIRVDPFWTVAGKNTVIATYPKRDGFDRNESFEITACIVEVEIEYFSNTFDPYE